MFSRSRSLHILKRPSKHDTQIVPSENEVDWWPEILASNEWGRWCEGRHRPKRGPLHSWSSALWNHWLQDFDPKYSGRQLLLGDIESLDQQWQVFPLHMELLPEVESRRNASNLQFHMATGAYQLRKDEICNQASLDGWMRNKFWLLRVYYSTIKKFK